MGMNTKTVYYSLYGIIKGDDRTPPTTQLIEACVSDSLRYAWPPVKRIEDAAVRAHVRKAAFMPKYDQIILVAVTSDGEVCVKKLHTVVSQVSWGAPDTILNP